MGSDLIIVIAVLSVIVTGIGVFLFSMDRKITRLEKKMKQNNE